MLNLLLFNFNIIKFIQIYTYRLAIWDSKYIDNNKKLI